MSETQKPEVESKGNVYFYEFIKEKNIFFVSQGQCHKTLYGRKLRLFIIS
jgi:hypothetical protein